MLHFRHISRSVVLAVLLTASVACCANPHFFPRLRPLFPGLDESRVPAASRVALAQAKEDFQLAREGRDPRHARRVNANEPAGSRVFHGKGYELTIVHRQMVTVIESGPAIVIDGSVTGGKPFRYDEVDRAED